MKWGWTAALAALALAACDKVGDPNESVCANAHAAPADRVTACTALIEAGHLEGEARAALLANRGQAHRDANETTPALRDFEASLALDNKNIVATLGRAGILLDSGQLDAGEVLVDRLIANEQELAQAYLMKGRIAYGRGDYAAAVTQFDHALAKDGHLSQALALRGRARDKLGDEHAALADYAAAIAIAPPRADALAWRCWVRLSHIKDRGGDEQAITNQARADAEAATRADPRFVEGQTCLGVLRLRAGDWASAKAAFEEALEAEPGNPVALFGRGVARRRGGDGRGSEDMFQATEFNAHVRELYLSLGVETY